MIKAGNVLCCHCFRTFAEAYYYNTDLALWVQLKRSLFGKYYVEVYNSESTPSSSNISVKLSSQWGVLSGRDNRHIKVDVRIDSDVHPSILFTRACPFCSDETIHEIVYETYELPTFVIGMVGPRHVGKSTWINALSTAKNQLSIDYPYILSSIKLGESKSQMMTSTHINSEGSSNMFVIEKYSKHSKKRIPVANVLIKDVAGEIFNEGSSVVFEETDAYKLFRGTQYFDGVDAVVFIDAPDIADKNLKDAYNTVYSLNLLADKPVAYVLNKLDLIYNEPREVKFNDNKHKVPLLTKDTFKDSGIAANRAKRIIPRIKLETAITSAYRDLAALIFRNNPHSAGFLIKCGTPIDDKNINYNDSLNVMDPIIWVLNELDIFPIK